MTVPVLPLEIEQNSSFDHTLQWYGGGKFIAPIEDIRVGYPTEFRVTGHGLNAVSPTPVIISGVEGLRDVNSVDTGIDLGSRIDDNWFSMPVSSVGETWDPAGTGEITYWRPSNIAGWGGECNIRKNWYTATPYHTISTVLGTMTLNGTDGSIRLQIASDVTGAFNFVNAVYDIDLWPSGGARPTDGSQIVRVFKGPVKMMRDI